MEKERIVQVVADGLDTLIIEVDGKKDKINVKDFLRIDETNIEKEFADNPSLYAYYASVLSWYQYEEDKLEARLDEIVSQKDLTLRKKFATAKERELKSWIDLEEDVIEAREALMKAKYVVRKLGAFVKGVEKKGDRLIQIYAKYRAQMKQEGYF